LSETHEVVSILVQTTCRVKYGLQRSLYRFIVFYLHKRQSLVESIVIYR